MKGLVSISWREYRNSQVLNTSWRFPKRAKWTAWLLISSIRYVNLLLQAFLLRRGKWPVRSNVLIVKKVAYYENQVLFIRCAVICLSRKLTSLLEPLLSPPLENWMWTSVSPSWISRSACWCKSRLKKNWICLLSYCHSKWWFGSPLLLWWVLRHRFQINFSSSSQQPSPLSFVQLWVLSVTQALRDTERS